MTIALAAGRASGVTRFGDITRLDTIGVPVWQAVRPWSRSISVNQGKGLAPDVARISAALEAVECACAEAWAPDEVIMAAPEDRRVAARTSTLNGFARGELTSRDRATPIPWTSIPRPDGAGDILVPVAFVSLDLTRTGPSWVIRCSNGQGAGDTRERARLKGLCELVERDAFAAWARRSPIDRLRDEIAPESIELDWFTDLRRAFADQHVRLRLYALPGAIDLPIIAAELLDGRSQLRSRAHAAGTCAHPDPEQALLGAVTEAAQARLGQIAGSRDDLDPLAPVNLPNFIGFALPRPGRLPAHDFADLQRKWLANRGLTSADLAEALSAAGYPETGVVEFAAPVDGVHVVKMINPSLVQHRASRHDPL